MKGKPAVFLDRDGTLIVEVNYLSTLKALQLYAGAAGAVKEINNLKLPAILATNQSGIGRGMFTLKTLDAIHAKIQRLLKTGAKAKLDAIYYCPHLPEDYCKCRKPALGMVKLAKKALNIDPKNSYFIGDKETDIEFGRNAGGKTILVLTGYGKDSVIKMKEKPDFIAEDLCAAVNWIKEDYLKK